MFSNCSRVSTGFVTRSELRNWDVRFRAGLPFERSPRFQDARGRALTFLSEIFNGLEFLKIVLLNRRLYSGERLTPSPAGACALAIRQNNLMKKKQTRCIM